MSSMNPRSLFRLEALRRANVVAFSTVSALALMGTMAASPCAFAGTPPPSVLTYHNDNARTGVNPNETLLSPTTVAKGYTAGGVNYAFTKQFNINFEGNVYAQPLFVSNVKFTDPYTGQPRVGNLLIVATAANTVYAYPDDKSGYSQLTPSARPVWRVDYNYPILKIGPIPVSDLNPLQPTGYASLQDVQTQIGIIGTPAIEYNASTQGGRLYFVVSTKEGSNYFQRLHVLDLASGAELPNSPLVIASSLSAANPAIPGIDPLRNSQRGALTVNNGTVYIPWGFHNDTDAANYGLHGWLAGFRYDGQNFQMAGLYNTSPDSNGNSLGANGSGITMDNVFLYFSLGHGTFNANTGGKSYGGSIIEENYFLNWQRSFFAPYNVQFLNADETDIASGGITALPDPVAGAGQAFNQYLLATAGREGKIYLILRSYQNLGGFNPAGDNVYQEIPNATGPVYGPPVYFNNKIYFAGTADNLTAWSFSNLHLLPYATQRSPETFAYPGAIPAISSNGNANGIVWLVETAHILGTTGAEILHAYDANNLSNELFTGAVAGDSQHQTPLYFTVPTIANGRVYVGGTNSLAVFGFSPSAKK